MTDSTTTRTRMTPRTLRISSSSASRPSATLVGLSWFGFTASGLAGYVLFRRRRYPVACLLLGFYAGSGLVGIGHYSVGAMTEQAWWRQTHVVADIVLGLATVSFAVWAALRMPPRRATAPSPGSTP